MFIYKSSNKIVGCFYSQYGCYTRVECKKQWVPSTRVASTLNTGLIHAVQSRAKTNSRLCACFVLETAACGFDFFFCLKTMGPIHKGCFYSPCCSLTIFIYCQSAKTLRSGQNNGGGGFSIFTRVEFLVSIYYILEFVY